MFTPNYLLSLIITNTALLGSTILTSNGRSFHLIIIIIIIITTTVLLTSIILTCNGQGFMRKKPDEVSFEIINKASIEVNEGNMCDSVA